MMSSLLKFKACQTVEGVQELCRGQSDHNFEKFGNEILLWQKLAQESGENERLQAKCAFSFAQFRNAHAATALPTFTLSGRPISHSMKYALRFQKQFIQVARECSKESFTTPKYLIWSLTSHIHLFQKFW